MVLAQTSNSPSSGLAEAPAPRYAKARGVMADLESEPLYHLHSTPAGTINQDIQPEAVLPLGAACPIAGSQLHSGLQRPLFLPYGSRTKVADLLHHPTNSSSESAMIRWPLLLGCMPSQRRSLTRWPFRQPWS